jgi:excisionase family DNA binding protein
MTPIKKGAAPTTTPAPLSANHDDTRLAYSMREVAHLICISERSVWTLVNRGDLRCVRIGRSVRIPIDALREYLAVARR